jgi:hypothetical protein
MTKHPASVYANRPGWDGEGTYLECPLCPHIMKMMPPEDTQAVPIEPGLFEEREGESPMERHIRYAIQQNYIANDNLMWAHFEIHHTLQECVLVLGQARNALNDIHRAVAEMPSQPGGALDQFLSLLDGHCHDGLAVPGVEG